MELWISVSISDCLWGRHALFFSNQLGWNASLCRIAWANKDQKVLRNNVQARPCIKPWKASSCRWGGWGSRSGAVVLPVPVCEYIWPRCILTSILFKKLLQPNLRTVKATDNAKNANNNIALNLWPWCFEARFWSRTVPIDVSMLQGYPDEISKKSYRDCFSGTIFTSVATKQRLVHVAVHLLWWMEGDEVCLLLIKFLVASRGTGLEKICFFVCLLVEKAIISKS